MLGSRESACHLLRTVLVAHPQRRLESCESKRGSTMAHSTTTTRWQFWRNTRQWNNQRRYRFKIWILRDWSTLCAARNG
ncbi:hypothetical protein D6D25_01737 [Aureobasidium pullulans]|nr:hypothetical protein D6D25_01737 [Aureobasidium pullulans]